MRLGSIDGSAVLVLGDAVAGLDAASGGRLGPDLAGAYARWDEVLEVAAGDPSPTGPFDPARLGCPVDPRQVFAVGLNYRDHAAETGKEVPDIPATFTKFPACLGGPYDDVELSGDQVDWEVELVVVMGRRADRVAEADAWDHVAGLTVGQDISDRVVQYAAGFQFSLGKSYRGYGPIGPVVVTPDELPDRDDLLLRCTLDGEVVQEGRTSDMVFSVPRLIAELSAVVPLAPGDVIFTGTPAGVGAGRQPPRFLQPGQVLESTIEGIGTLRNHIR